MSLAFTIAVGSVLATTIHGVGQTLPPATKAERVTISDGPALEIGLATFAIIRWSTNTPGGTDVHYGVVYYGTDPNDLRQVAKSSIRLNRAHAETTFRVRVSGLQAATTYYYRVTSTDANGASDWVQSPVRQFTTMAGRNEQ
jgi:phosphodiesterase/alkaline phosphatase D-like protein